MKSIYLIFIAFAIVFFEVSCSKFITSDGSVKEPKTIVKEKFTFLKSVPLFEQANQNRSPEFSAPFEISKAETVKDSVKITVTYLQGCEGNKFDVIWSGMAIMIYPMQIVLMVKRTATNCGTLGAATSQVLAINIAECIGISDSSIIASTRFIICNTSLVPDGGSGNSDITISSNITNIDQLNGVWKWESTCGGFTGACTNSSTSNYATIEFSSNGKYTEMHNDTIYQQANYKVIKNDDISGKLILDNTDYIRPISIVNNHLEITRGDLIDTYLKTK